MDHTLLLGEMVDITPERVLCMSRPRRLWLSRKAEGRYMLTEYAPVLAKRTHMPPDLYVQYGDPLVVQWLCEFGVRTIFGVELQPLDMIEVTLEGKTLA